MSRMVIKDISQNKQLVLNLVTSLVVFVINLITIQLLMKKYIENPVHKS